MPQGIQEARLAAAQNIQAEAPGDYFIGRRYFKIPQFKFWGYVRRPGQPWSTAQLVVFNEKEKLAPDREQLDFGFDNNYEYSLRPLWRRHSYDAEQWLLSRVRSEAIRTHFDPSGADF
jgi:hypothetical protein